MEKSKIPIKEIRDSLVNSSGALTFINKINKDEMLKSIYTSYAESLKEESEIVEAMSIWLILLLQSVFLLPFSHTLESMVVQFVFWGFVISTIIIMYVFIPFMFRNIYDYLNEQEENIRKKENNPIQNEPSRTQ